MSEYGRYMEANLLIEKEDGTDWTEEEVNDLVEKLVYTNMEHGLMVGGGIGPMKEREKECNYCEGSGIKDFIDEDERCETCGGSGRKEEEEPQPNPEAEQEWNKIYAPIAQVEEHSPPKGKVEGSSPSRSANVRNGCDRERDREPGEEDLQGDSKGDRERCEDPGRDHSGEDG